ncbi:MAG TPA: nucleotidyltransferase family protein [Alphaproteobacteria bacterium]|nr:nucleotidyltransferase family protein [Alphaproteobacteria bacterium]
MLQSFADLEPEARVLLLCARPRLDPAARAEVERLLDAVDWTVLVRMAEAHGVTALALRRLADIPGVPPEIAAAGETYLANQAARNAALTRALKDVIVALAAKGIPAIPFKGPVVAQLAYGDPALRRYRDLDILVREKDAAAACEALTALGFRATGSLSPAQLRAFRRYSGQDIVFKGDVAVEPHWALAPRTLSLRIDYEGLWTRAREIDLEGQPIFCFGPEDLVTVLCLHGSKEQWTLLLWIADLAHMIAASPALDWPALLRRARTQGVLRMVLIGLILAGEAIELPAGVKEAIAADPIAHELAEQAAARLFALDRAEESIYRLSSFRHRMRERAGDRWRYVIRTVTTPRDMHYSIVKLPDALFFLYTPIKLVHDYLLLPFWMSGKRLTARRDG